MQNKNDNPNKSFNLLEIIWPIKLSEMSIFLPTAIIMFCFLANFSALRALKDSLIIPALGAEIISFLKVWFVLPFGVLFTILYASLSNYFNIKKIYFIVITFFNLILLLFAFVIYPNMQDNLNFDIFGLAEQFPYFKRLISIFAAWHLSLIYVIGDMWGSIMINLMFWQLANLITNKETAKRFYPTFGIVGNFGLIISGILLNNLSCLSFDLIEAFTKIGFVKSCLSTQIVCIYIVTLNLLSLFLVNKIIKSVAKKHEKDLTDDLQLSKQVSEKTKLSLFESIKLIMNTKVLLYITVMVISYNIVITIVEGPWKAQIKLAYPTQLEYLGFMGVFNKYLGLSAIAFVIIGNLIMQRFSWLYSALFSPIVIGITGLIFFMLIIFSDVISFGVINPIFAAVFIGTVQNILSKSSKYSIFDASKEIIYIPLSLELKSKGKAAVEIIGAKIGKSLGSFIQFIIFSNSNLMYEDIYNYLLVIFLIVIGVWIYNIFQLDKELKLS